MLFRRNRLIAYLLVFAFLFSTYSCAVHDHFPFICFRKGCVRDQFGAVLDVGAMKKRIKGKMNVRKRKRNQKDVVKVKQKNRSFSAGRSNEDNDSTSVIKGRNVDYTKYLLVFKLNADTICSDSIDIVHSSEYKTIIETDQSRLDDKLDTLVPKITIVYIKEINRKDDPVDIVKKRNESIRRYLHDSGIAYRRIKIVIQTN